jgi:cell division protein FtsB
LWACAAAYLGYHVVQGDRGLIAWLHLTKEVEQVTASLDLANGERARTERNVALLRPDGLDPDLLDERARVVLGLGHPRDLVIFGD